MVDILVMALVNAALFFTGYCIGRSRSQLHYWSTACHHRLHDRCRHTCKFCSRHCECPCHLSEKTTRINGGSAHGS